MFEVFEWKVRFAGFTHEVVRTVEVEAPNYQEAVQKGEREMDDRGFNPDDFTVTLVERGRPTGKTAH